MAGATRSGKVMCSIVQHVIFWIITRALQTQLISVPASGLAQTRTIMRLTRYLTQQASYSSSHAAALRKEKHIHIDFLPSNPYIVPHFFGYPPGGPNWTYHVFFSVERTSSKNQRAQRDWTMKKRYQLGGRRHADQPHHYQDLARQR